MPTYADFGGGTAGQTATSAVISTIAGWFVVTADIDGRARLNKEGAGLATVSGL